MTGPATRERLQGFGVLVGVLMGAAMLGWTTLKPIMDGEAALREARGRIEKFAATARTPPPNVVDTSAVIESKNKPEVQSLATQRMIVDDAKAAGLVMQQLTVAPAQEVKRDLLQLSFDMELSGDLQAWTVFVSLLGERRPVILIDEIALKGGPGLRPDIQLGIRMRASSYVQRVRG